MPDTLHAQPHVTAGSVLRRYSMFCAAMASYRLTRSPARALPYPPRWPHLLFAVGQILIGYLIIALQWLALNRHKLETIATTQ